MSVFVKICGLSDAASVEAAVHAGADAIGFVFTESPRRVTPARAAELTRDVPGVISRFAVTRHPRAAELDEIFATFAPDYLQTDVEDFAAITLPANCSPMPVYREHGHGHEEPPAGTRILFEGRDSGTGRTADWHEARRLARRCELILAGGLNADNVAAAIEQVHPWGVDVSSGVERERGIKDPVRIREFIARARAQENTVD
ncbi:MAG: phosphoribosylanthranilate isomerase [Gammaproteobacteria bacterium]|jgi:phosphoribosylanthranilate isomerase